MSSRLFAIFLPLAILLASCTHPTSAADPSIPVALQSNMSGNFEYEIDLGDSPKDLYFVFTNTNLDVSASSYPSVDSLFVNEKALPSPEPQPARAVTGSDTSLEDFLAEYRSDPFGKRRPSGSKVVAALAPEAPSLDVVNGTADFGDFDSSNNIISVPSTCRYVSPAITVGDGSTRKLNIWVADDCWGASSTKKHYITQEMVDALAAKFLVAGTSNDIYDWVTNILGPEWGQTQFAELIDFDGEITILLSDLEQDDADNGGMVGYFWNGNNFKQAYEADSNQRIMFAVDAVMYANPDPNGYGVDDTEHYTGGTWLPTAYWAEDLYSTLAHEFQHMIQFYAKGILVRGDGKSAETWINEMCSQVVEDLVADKLEVMGPRGIEGDGSAGAAGNAEGRIPIFNAIMTRGLTKNLFYDTYDYSFSYAFGAWLARNYGGAQFVKRVVSSSAIDEGCVTSAVAAAGGRSEGMEKLLGRWALSILASDKTDMPAGYRLNRGDWFLSSEGGIEYRLGSIDFFNYDPQPAVLDSSSAFPSDTQPKASNVFYRAGSALTGKQSWSIRTPEGVVFNAYAAED